MMTNAIDRTQFIFCKVLIFKRIGRYVSVTEELLW